MTNKPHGVLYVGVTNDLVRRVYEHREGIIDGFTQKYKLKQLVWYEVHTEIEQAIVREKRIKEWKRDWKLELIERENPQWCDLWSHIIGDSDFRRNDEV